MIGRVPLALAILLLAFGEFGFAIRPSWGRTWPRFYWALRAWVSAPILLASETLVNALCQSRTLHGMRVGVLERRKAEDSWRRIDEALDIISRFDSRRFRSLRSDVARILVLPVKRTSFSLHTRTCTLNANWVDQQGSVNIAGALVHEATHARLRRSGLTAFGADLSERVEALCVREQIAFMRGLPPGRFPGVDRLLLYLEDVRRTYPPTQAWPRPTTDRAHRGNSILLTGALLLLILDWWVRLPDLVGIAVLLGAVGLCALVVRRAWRFRTS